MSDTQRLPNLYQLLGLPGQENNLEKISASLKRAQAKADALKADKTRAADVSRLEKVVVLGQKYLLNPKLKTNYDAQWNALYGSNSAAAIEQVVTEQAVTPSMATRNAAAAPQAVAASRAVVAKAVSTTSTDQLDWDMSSLDALLPTADPHAPFQMADYLRTSQVRDPLAAEADLRKLISLLGGEVADANDGASTAATPLATGQPLWHSGTDAQGSASVDTGLSMPRSTGTPAAAVALAKRMRQKRQRAMLLGGAVLTAAVGGLVLLSFYLNRPAPQVAQAPAVPIRTSPPPVTLPEPAAASNNTETNQAATSTVNPNSTVLIQPGENVKPMEIQATPLPKPDAMAMADKPAAEPMKPETPQPESPKPTPEPSKPEPAKPEPAKPDPAKPDPQATKPEVTKPAEMPADVKLSDKEKKVWQDDMKRVRAGLSKLDPATSEQQIEALKALAKTGEQRAQLSTLEQAVGLVRKAREALVLGVGSLESGQTFMVGSSTEVAFVEGDETRIIVRVSGRKEYKLEAIPAAMGVVLMKMKPNVVDANLEAAMGAYIMVQTKKNSSATTQGKKLLEDAAAAGAISKELAQFYEEDYKL